MFLLFFSVGLCFINVSLFAQEESESLYGKIIKEIRFEGLKKTKEYIITRELISKVGEPLLKENLDKDYLRLDRLDVFSKISIVPAAEDDGVILTYNFVETFPFLPSIAFQITDENGISAGGGGKTPNLLGEDIFMAARVLAGGALTVEFRIENPWFTGNHFGYKLEYYHRERENQIENFFETANEFYLRIGGYLGENGRIGGSLEYVNINSDVDGVTLSPDNSERVARTGFYLGYDSRDSLIDTRKGWWSEISFSREMRIFKKSTNFYQIDLDIRRFQPLPFWDRHTLALFSLLTLRTGEVDTDVAPWQQFGVGGTNTVRGWEYAFQKGKNQFVNTIEYRITLIKPRYLLLPFNINFRGGLQFCLFGDFGMAWSEKGQFKVSNFIGGYGFGIRLLLPIVGVTRVDFGWGQNGQGISVHLGAFEKSVMARRRVR